MATFDKSFEMERHHGGKIRKTTGGKYVAERTDKVKGKWIRRRETFDLKSAAINSLKEQGTRRRIQGDNASALTKPQNQDALDALHRLKVKGMEVYTLCEAVDYFIKHRHHKLEQWTVTEAIEKRIADMKARNLRPDSIAGTNKILNKFKEKFGEYGIRDIRKEQVDAWLEEKNKLTARTVENNRVEIATLFNYCESKLKNYSNTVCKQTPKKDKPKKDETPAETMTPKQVENFLRYIEKKKDPSYAASFALMFFAGIRPKEMTRTGRKLMWKDIHLNEVNEIGGLGVIKIDGGTSKIRKMRKIPITPNLREWLIRYQGEGQIGHAYSTTSEVRRDALKKGAKMKDWIQDYPRHTFGTAAAEIYGIHKAAQWMGHVGGIRTFLKHYEGVTNQKDAKAFFNIMPREKEQGKIIKMEASA